MLFILIFFFPIFAFGLELNLVCTNNSSGNTEVDVKDIFVLINTDENTVEVGGLSLKPSKINVTESNISWLANDLQLYPDSEGEVYGLIGRFSGELVLNFKRYEDNKSNSLIFSCRKFKIKDRRF
tara:strand:+ start:269 stop:643 length:375 start_codon:yes stop_codon:yes gene_type:complete